jgi:hypothetical protein
MVHRARQVAVMGAAFEQRGEPEGVQPCALCLLLDLEQEVGPTSVSSCGESSERARCSRRIMSQKPGEEIEGVAVVRVKRHHVQMFSGHGHLCGKDRHRGRLFV